MTALYSRDYIHVPVVFHGMQIRGWGKHIHPGMDTIVVIINENYTPHNSGMGEYWDYSVPLTLH